MPKRGRRAIRRALRHRTPADRATEAFVKQHGTFLRGRVLVFAEPGCVRDLHGDISSIDVVDVDPRNRHVTVLADLDDEGSLPRCGYDCVLLIDGWHQVQDVRRAMTNGWDAVAPGGVMLLTWPAPDPGAAGAGDIERALRCVCPGADMNIMAFGSLLTGRVMKQGAA